MWELRRYIEGIGDVKLSLTLNTQMDWLECYFDLFLYMKKRVLIPPELKNITGANLKELIVSSIM